MLLIRSATGDEGAFGDLYDATSAHVYGLALSILRSPTRAEAAAQAIYLEIWKSSGYFDPGRGTAIAWITAIAHHQATGRLRSTQNPDCSWG